MAIPDYWETQHDQMYKPLDVFITLSFQSVRKYWITITLRITVINTNVDKDIANLEQLQRRATNELTPILLLKTLTI